MELTDSHTHTWLSRHGIGTVDDVVEAALGRGLGMVALTEHLPLPPEVDDGTFAMEASMMGEYLDSLEKARRRHPNIEIITGFEVDWRLGAEGYILEWLRGLPAELLIGSVHMLTDAEGNQWEFDHPQYSECWDLLDEEQVWQRYFDLWKQALASKVPFDIMAHPDLPKKLGHKPTFDTEGLYAAMAQEAARAEVMIEVNTSGLYKPVKELYPAPALLRAFCEAGVPCSISSDAHKPEDVGRSLSRGYAALRAANYTHVTVPTRSGDRREIPLD